MASLKMILALFMIAMLAFAAAVPSGYFVLDDEDLQGANMLQHRIRRDDYSGHFAPVYVLTHQSTDKEGNFKWHVRHNVGHDGGHGGNDGGSGGHGY